MNKLQTIILVLNIILCVRKNGSDVSKYLKKNSCESYDSIDAARLQQQKDIDHGNNVRVNRELELHNEKEVQENMKRRGGHMTLDPARLEEQKDIDHGNNVRVNRLLHNKNMVGDKAFKNEKEVQENMKRRGGHMTHQGYIDNQHNDELIIINNKAFKNEMEVQENMFRRVGHMTHQGYIVNQHNIELIL